MKLSHSQDGKKMVLEFLRKTPIRSDRRLKIYAMVQRFFWKIKYPSEKYKTLVMYQPISPSSINYGHEYWLKKYSGFPDKIYAHVEHGVYFGEQRMKSSAIEEWDLGNFITFGDSRVKLLHELYPDYNIFPIGPRIHYAETDEDYYNELYKKIDHSSRVLTLYPAHSLASTKSLYDSKLFLEQAETLAEKIGAKTIMVSLHPSDYLHHLDLEFRDKNVIFVGGGGDPFNFLPRLRAILKLSDLTFSNSLGTHIGYSVYMGTPHVMKLESNHNVEPIPHYKEEQDIFAKAFCGDEDPLVITEEQKELCDYYFGFSHIKSPEELYKCLAACRDEYNKRFK